MELKMNLLEFSLINRLEFVTREKTSGTLPNKFNIKA